MAQITNASNSQSIPLLDESQSKYQEEDHENSNGRIHDSMELDTSEQEKVIVYTYSPWYRQPISQNMQHFKHYCSTISINRSKLIPLLPLCFQPNYLSSQSAKKLRPTSYLDALRGFAAIIVVNHHFMWTSPYTLLPFINVLRQGRAMVDIFFIISGYVLTQKMLKLSRQRKDSELLQCLASSAFRRYLRLYLSACLAAFMNMWLDYFTIIHDIRSKPLLKQLADFGNDMLQFTNPFANVAGYWYRGALDCKYHSLLWTIPVEFRGSIVVFVFCLACCRLTYQKRQILCCILIFICYIWYEVYVALFLFGVFLADRGITRQQEEEEEAASLQVGRVHLNNRSIKTHVWTGFVLLLGLFLCNQPEHLGLKGPWPWQYLSQLIPFWWPDIVRGQEHFWLSIASALVLYSLEACPTWQKPFNHVIAQYIGHLSFGIYLMGYPVKRLYFMEDFLDYLKHHIGNNILTWLIYYPIFMFILLWAADYFMRIDKRVIDFGRWVEKKMFVFTTI